MSQSETANLDPYKQAAENTSVTLQEKIRGMAYHSRISSSDPVIDGHTDLHAVVNAAKTGMLVTRDSSGNLHSRAMTPASRACPSKKKVHL